MNKKKKWLMFPAILLAVVLMGNGCMTASSSTANQEQKLTEENQSRLLSNQPPVKLDWSLERENINRRTNLWNDSSKLSYIYLVSYGKVMAFYTIEGKVSSVNSQVTNTDQIATKYVNGSRYAEVLASPSEDGSYGTNGDAIFFFTTEGVYVEWAGSYMLADEPLQLTTPPALVRTIQ